MRGATFMRCLKRASVIGVVVLGLAVATEGRVLPALPPHTHDTEVRDDISTDLAALSRHTHGRAANTREVITELAALFHATSASPVKLHPAMSNRKERAMKAAIYKWDDERTYGPGGLKAYNKRMYGK